MAAVSPAACAPCHREETRGFAASAMTRALERAGDSPILRENSPLTAAFENYSYQIARSGSGAAYTVSDGKNTVGLSLEWAFGQGSAGQTYLYQREGRWYEARVSYYSALKRLDLTMGTREITVHNAEDAAGRPLTPRDTADCFGCHATGAVKGREFDSSGMTPGVQCERCHGASPQHLAGRGAMKKLGQLSTEELSDFCGECHRSWSQIMVNGPRGVLNVRFQPYRLAGSKCYDAEDPRIRCTACHNPHAALEKSPRAYDTKCLACHSPPASGKASHRICQVSKTDCVTCHMPKVELPEAHKLFADHRIRIVRTGEAYPD
ncbi:MAG: multiheme c-type cytochrome [Acidobacteriota bacterium]